jgi:hypothetical protein
VTIASAPLDQVQDGRRGTIDLPDGLSEIFLRAGLDSRLSVDRVWEIGFLAQLIFTVIPGRCGASSPESISADIPAARRIPGLHSAARASPTDPAINKTDAINSPMKHLREPKPGR